MQHCPLSEATLIDLCHEQGLIPGYIVNYLLGEIRVWEFDVTLIEDWPHIQGTLYLCRSRLGWQVQTGVVKGLERRLAPPGICTDGDCWWVNTGPRERELGAGLERLAVAVRYA